MIDSLAIKFEIDFSLTCNGKQNMLRWIEVVTDDATNDGFSLFSAFICLQHYISLLIERQRRNGIDTFLTHAITFIIARAFYAVELVRLARPLS